MFSQKLFFKSSLLLNGYWLVVRRSSTSPNQYSNELCLLFCIYPCSMLQCLHCTASSWQNYRVASMLFNLKCSRTFTCLGSCSTRLATSGWTRSAGRSSRASAVSHAAARNANSTPSTTQLGLSQVSFFYFFSVCNFSFW